MKGVFITFEGGEGVGKSTQVRLLMEYLEKSNQDALLVRQPGGEPIAEQIRQILLSKNNVEMTAECEALLYAAARAQLVKEVILPALDAGKIVVCDRHIDSSLAYQGVARGLGIDRVLEINAPAVEGCPIDATVFLNLPHDKMFRSRQKSAAMDDRFEAETAEFHKRVYDGFCEVAKRFPERFITILPCENKQDTSDSIINSLRERGLIK